MMKLKLMVASLIVLTTVISPFSVSASEAEYDPVNTSGEVLCLPGSFYQPKSDCSLLGPSAYLYRMADLGVTFPLHSVAGKVPDPSLTYVDVRYGEVVRQNASVYASLEDAVKKGKVVRKIDSPYSFISYRDEAVVDGKRYYMVDFGGWMTANDISRIGTPSLFQGKAFSQTPERSFGWIS
ncbi:MAG: hypothetical protein IMY85_01930, partial [Chloroflexi bacterium]|nr:hypothetical protein [Chloroflexota bacterium]